MTKQAKNEVVTLQQQQGEILPTQNSPMSMMQAAIQGGMDLDKLEKMMELQAEWDRREAKKAYVVAMTKFKADPPDIEKDKHVSFKAGSGTTEYNHASLSNVTRKISSHLSKYGLSASWETNQNNGDITVTCIITHIDGHSERTSLTAKPDSSGTKNAIQSIGSTVSYLQRYTVLSICGLATGEKTDDDGIGSGKPPEYVTEDQISQIIEMIGKTETDEKKFFEYIKADSVETILAKDFQKAMTALRAKEKQAKKKKEDTDA